jgi:hypothetical protein
MSQYASYTDISKKATRDDVYGSVQDIENESNYHQAYTNVSQRAAKTGNIEDLIRHKEEQKIEIQGTVDDYQTRDVQKITIAVSKPENVFNEDQLVIRPESESILRIIHAAEGTNPAKDKKFVLSFIFAGDKWQEYKNNKTHIMITEDGTFKVYNNYGVLVNDPKLMDCRCKLIDKQYTTQLVEIEKIKALQSDMIAAWGAKYLELNKKAVTNTNTDPSAPSI